MKKIKKRQKGTITPALLVITSAFLVVIYGILFVLTVQFDFSRRQAASESALNIAEAGINYYRWHLAHDPDDFQDGTGGPGPYIHDYLDPQGASMGSFILEVTPPDIGSSIVTIKSTGSVNEFSRVQRTIVAKYGQPSLAEFSFLTNASNWYGNSISTQGRVHSNNGVRMDGVNTSLVSSAKETYTCGTETGCNPSEEKPGVWGSGGDAGLWQFPLPVIDFDLISFNFADMRQVAQNDGLYLEKFGGPKKGYHIIFNSDGTFTLYKVKKTEHHIKGYSLFEEKKHKEEHDDDHDEEHEEKKKKKGCKKLRQTIKEEELVGIYNVSDIPILFSENPLWIEGTLNGRITVIAAAFPLHDEKMDIWIPNNLTYATNDGTSALGLVAQHDIYFTRDVPDDFKIDGVLMAQTGSVMRHGYIKACGDTTGALKDKLTINGSVISYYSSYWNFDSPPVSGFRESTISYDTNLKYNPPPYFPTYGEYEFISWTEE